MINLTPNKIKFDNSKFSTLIKNLNYDLPDEFIEFLKKYNGGYVNDSVSTYYRNGRKRFIVKSLFGLGLDFAIDLLEQFAIYKKRIPSSCIPIASDAGGNIICLNLADENYGYVYFWDHEKETNFKFEEITVDDLYPIANSFNVFLNSIEPDSLHGYELDGYEVKTAWIDPDFLKELKNNFNK